MPLALIPPALQATNFITYKRCLRVTADGAIMPAKSALTTDNRPHEIQSWPYSCGEHHCSRAESVASRSTPSTTAAPASRLRYCRSAVTEAFCCSAMATAPRTAANGCCWPASRASTSTTHLNWAVTPVLKAQAALVLNSHSGNTGTRQGSRLKSAR